LIVVRLKDQGYLNDAKYATAFSSYRRDNEKFGRMRVVNDLKAKGVHVKSSRRRFFRLRRCERRKSRARLSTPQTAAEAKDRDQKQTLASSPIDARGVWIEDHLYDPEKMDVDEETLSELENET